jgi:Domain of unknown function (DUF4260)
MVLDRLPALLAYLAGARAGTLTYDLMHFAAFPIALGAIGVTASSGVCVQLALIWLGHIGIDRALGFGLKYSSGMRDSHLQRV